MNCSLPIPNVSFLRSRQPSLAELETLLDYIPQASFLLDLEKHRIVLANAMATELTAFTRAELIKSDLAELLPFLSNHIQDIYSSSKPEPYIDTIATRQGQGLEVRVQVASLDEAGTWGLLTCEPSRLREREAAEQKRRTDRLLDLYSLVKSNQEANTERALQLALEAGHQLTGADTLAIYLIPADKPGLQRHLAQDLQDFSLPEFIAADEVDDYLEPATWEPGQRASNTLFRAARVAKMGYLQTYPLREEQVFTGILVLSAVEGGIPADNLAVLKILSATIISVLQNNAKIDRLLKKQDELLKEIRIGETIVENTQDGIILLSPDLQIQQA